MFHRTAIGLFVMFMQQVRVCHHGYYGGGMEYY